ncbi:sensor histidine kinase [Roseivirga echinicomitans]
MESGKEIAYKTFVYLGTLGMLLLASAVVLFIYLYQRKLLKKKIAFQEIEDLLRKQELKSTYALMEGKDIERKRIAEELHDNLGSILVTLNMYTDTALSTDDLTHKNELISRISEIATQASDETRKLSHRLDSVSLKHFGLKTALNDLVNAIREIRYISIESNILINNSINGDISLNIYRIAQELINNTLKHSEAKEIRIELQEVANDYLSFIYSDNGVGFNQNQVVSGMGLTNIRARVHKMAGEISIDSSSKGINVIIEIPLK